jgi:hypothetical protein
MGYNIQNNFSKLKSEFKLDTKLDADTHMELYVQYFTARMTDKIMQHTHILVTETVNGLQHLPGSMRTQMAEMLRSLKKDNLI